ncbi:MAG: hypothetical protein LHW64_03890 [Candidatus Cloacimonetes bacterium]|jgi:hypothetical protein|nr:hypothetical protein [Candidatus Cloacimonadota bacterium]MCB5286927.1 hypothetical protein [Candidatus Cloacimonadota bacterium]MCK9184131.1 hypothetical protein [Candidatus Cloacimonadota bacterium]MCK9584360.1 hypothetical protein [Candidatus Cloacimonadota bacterium]MDY0229248.1 hypothetical protein [Candidatus Cloacimonadaceae bacterium]
MRSKKSKIVKELDPQEVEGVSQARIEHYLALGYRPYMDEKSHVKWLTEAQMSMRGVSNRHVRHKVPFRIFPQKRTGRYRKKRGHRSFFRFIKDNMGFILISLLIFMFLILVYLKPGLIF